MLYSEAGGDPKYPNLEGTWDVYTEITYADEAWTGNSVSKVVWVANLGLTNKDRLGLTAIDKSTTIVEEATSNVLPSEMLEIDSKMGMGTQT